MRGSWGLLAAGALLAGVLGAATESRAASLKTGPNSDWGVEPVYVDPVYHPPGAHWRWVPGYWTYVTEWVWTGGRHERYWVPAAYETRYDEHGQPHNVCVHGGYWATRWVPGRRVPRQVRRWIAGRWQHVGPCYRPCPRPHPRPWPCPYPCRYDAPHCGTR